jgi:hypothetical protein
MRYLFMLAAALIVTSTACAASDADAVFALQLDCTTQKALDMASSVGSEAVRASKAADLCVNEKDLAAGRRSVFSVTPSVEARRQELETRKATMVRGTLRRIAMCRAEGISDQRLGAECVALFNGSKGPDSSAE